MLDFENKTLGEVLGFVSMIRPDVGAYARALSEKYEGLFDLRINELADNKNLLMHIISDAASAFKRTQRSDASLMLNTCHVCPQCGHAHKIGILE